MQTPAKEQNARSVVLAAAYAQSPTEGAQQIARKK
jgi:hypothetical protein